MSPFLADVPEVMPVDMDRMRGLVAKQQAVHDGILQNIKEFEDQYEADKQVNASRVAAFTIVQEDAGSQSKLRSATSLASRMHNKKKRGLSFEQRRQDGLAHQELIRAQYFMQQQSQEDRAAKRLQEMFAEQKRRAFYVQAKKNEQCKIREDLIREQRNAWSRFYDKAHEKSAEDRHPQRPRTKGLLSRSMSAPMALTVEDEPVYRRAMESHRNYNDTLCKWNDLVEENTRRSDLHWRRTTGFAPVRPKEVKKMRQGGNSPARPLSPGSPDGAGSSASICPDSSTLRRSTTWAQWVARKQKVDQHHIHLDELGTQKSKRTEEKLEMASKRKDAEVQKVRHNAESYNESWTERQKEVVERKQKIMEDGFADTHEKHQRVEERHAEFRQRELEELARRAEVTDGRIRSATTLASELLIKSEESRRAKIQEKVSKSEEILAEIHGDLVKKGKANACPNGTSSTGLKEKVSEDFRRKAEHEMKEKDARKEKLFKQRSMGVLDRLREDRGKCGKVAREHSSLEETLGLDNDLAPSPANHNSSVQSLTVMSDEPWDSFPVTPAAAGSVVQTPSFTQTPSYAQSPLLTRPAALRPASLDNEGRPGSSSVSAVAVGSRPGTRQGVETGVEANDEVVDDEEEIDDTFLEELEKRSSKWLKEMRAKRDM